MPSELQKAAAQAIVNVFETGSARGEYGKVTLLRGDTGGLTYGRAQTTLASGNLHLLIEAYCAAEDATLDGELRPFLDRLEACDRELDHSAELKHLLREAGEDPAMRAVQDRFFDDVYWKPAKRSAAFIGIETALGHAVVYDGRVHGSWQLMRDRTNENEGPLSELGEEAWVAGYVSVRRDWLANHSNMLLHRTVYRMDAFAELIDKKLWDLILPFTVRAVRIDKAALVANEPLRVSAHDEATRVLRLRQPFMQGEDVRQVQKTLAAAGFELGVDGVYGPNTQAAVARFQSREGLAVDGAVGPATWIALGLD